MIDKIRIFIKTPRGESLFQLAKFGVVGATNMLISSGVYYLAVYAFNLHFQIGNALGFLASLTNAYFLNHFFVFRPGPKPLGRHLQSYARSFLIYGSSQVINALLLQLWLGVLGVNEAWGPFINLPVIIPINFLFNKMWAFKKSPEGSSDEKNKHTGADVQRGGEHSPAEPGDHKSA